MVPLLSVVIPTFNRPQILEKTLECLEFQNCDVSFEVIIIDDYPAGVMPNLGLGRGKRRQWKLIRNARNLGRAASRNLGIRAARGKYILFLDDDIWTEPQLLQAHYDKQQEIGGGVVVGAVPIAKEVPYDIWNDYYRRWVESLHLRMERIKDDLTYHYFFTGNVSVPRDILFKAGLFDEDFKGYSAEDTELGYRLKKMGVKMVYEPRAIGWHYNIETYQGILNKEYHCGLSAYILYKKHPELAEEISVAGLLAPGKRGYQYFLSPLNLSMGKLICRLIYFVNQPLCLRLFKNLAEAYYAYGIKEAKMQK